MSLRGAFVATTLAPHSHSATLRGLCAFGAVQVSNLLFEKEIALVAALPRNDSRNSDKISW